MDKNWKLLRYDRKDYTELVDFPVEIVGRDGVVRRYSYEDSIRLYQKRITSASNRYRDADLVRAEVNHCSSRIDQLRRSYFHRYGWGTPEGLPTAEESFGDLAGEVAAFLCRVLGIEGRPDVRFDLVEAERDGVATWYLTPHIPGSPTTSGMLLYFHRFEARPQDVRADGPPTGGTGRTKGESTAAEGEARSKPKDPARDAFFRRLKDLERSGRGTGDAERLVAFHHTVDCGLVLTGRAADCDALPPPKDLVSQPVDLAPTPWDELLEIVRKGDYEAALRRCKDLAQEQPWHRNAYVAGAMIANYLGEHLVGEDLALIGSRYFPADGTLLYYLGMSRLRQGRLAEAEQALRASVANAPDLVSARLMLAVNLLQSGRMAQARELLAERGSVVPDDRRAEADLALLEQWLRWRTWTLWAGIALVGLGVFATLGTLIWGASSHVGLLGALLVIPGVVVAALGQAAFRHELRSIADRQRFEEISQGLRRLHRRSRSSPRVS